MNPFGSTRTRLQLRHALIAPDGHVHTALPGWTDTEAVVLISPQMGGGGARFVHYLAFMAAGGEGPPPLPGVERFLLVLEGELEITTGSEQFTLMAGGYAYLPADGPHTLHATAAAELVVFERRYLAFSNADPPAIVTAGLDAVAGEPFLGDPDLRVQVLLPDEPSFDMAVNVMNFEPGAALPFVETHVMEHGLLMLQGGGIYRLDDAWYPVAAGDAIWMGAYCPQWFGALGKERARYLLYKDVNRDPFSFERES